MKYLRPVYKSDNMFLMAWRNTPEMLSVIRQSKILTYEDQLKWFENISSNDSHFIICDEGKSVGYCALKNVSVIHRTAEFSVWTIPKTNKGYFALKELFNYGFNSLGLNKIYSDVLEGNDRALKLYSVLGFHTEGTNREIYFKDGKFIDSISIGLLKREWVEVELIKYVKNHSPHVIST